MQDCSAEMSHNYSKGGGLVNLTVRKMGGKYVYMASLKYVQWYNRCEDKTGVLLDN